MLLRVVAMVTAVVAVAAAAAAAAAGGARETWVPIPFLLFRLTGGGTSWQPGGCQSGRGRREGEDGGGL